VTQAYALLRDDLALLRISLLAAGVYALLVAVPTVLVPNPLFARMLPTEWWNYAVLLAAAPLVGVAFALSRRAACQVGGGTILGGIAAYLAVGCAICNKAVVLLIGTSGALAWFAPVQPILGLAAIGVLAGYVHLQANRLTAEESATPDAERASVPGR
jgi:hypothetical protein